MKIVIMSIILILLISPLVLADNVYVISGNIPEVGGANVDPLYLLGSETEYEEDDNLGDYSAEFYNQAQILKTFYFNVNDTDFFI